MKKTFVFGLFAAAAVLQSCSSDEPGGNTPRRDIEVSRSEQEVIDKHQEFAFTLFNKGLENRGENVAYSPFSISTVLSMTANGTEGEMQREILDALDFKSTEQLDVMNSCAQLLLRELPTLDKSTTFMSSQSVWTADGMTLNGGFRKACADFYGASFGSYATADDGATAINEWVSRNTNGAIKDAVSPKDMGKIAIVNATYFKGQWMDQFKKENTRRLAFTNYDGSRDIVDMMSGSKDHYAYWDNDELQMARLPYGNGSISMYVVLPAEGKTAADVFAGMNREKWTQLKESMVPCTVNLKMPRFGFQTSNDIKETLRRLGINKLWDEATGAMTDSEVVMKKFLHNVRIIVDEEGTVAAASSSAIGGFLSPGPGEVVEMNCNRPFVCLIEEQSTGAILFIGAVNRL